MRVSDEDALLCDFAQYYRIYNLDDIPLSKAAVLACGLPPESRTMRKLTGADYSAEQSILMGILDELRNIEYAYACAHSKRKPKKPKSIFTLLHKKEESEIKAFETGRDFEKARERILRGC